MHRVPPPPCLQQHSLALFVWCCSPTSGRWCRVLVLICIFLLISDVVHSLITCVSSFEKLSPLLIFYGWILKAYMPITHHLGLWFNWIKVIFLGGGYWTFKYYRGDSVMIKDLRSTVMTIASLLSVYALCKPHPSFCEILVLCPIHTQWGWVSYLKRHNGPERRTGSRHWLSASRILLYYNFQSLV